MGTRGTKTGRSHRLLTRKQVAIRLQVSTSSVRRLEGTRLHPQQDERGVWWFDPSDVESLADEGSVRQRAASTRKHSNTTAGEVAARIFVMFAEGKGLRDIVVTARQPPERVRALFREWLVGLSEGERLRHERIEYERERKEDLEYERAQVAMIRALRS
jgi:hypothetical protein